jgi:hypothetical protein
VWLTRLDEVCDWWLARTQARVTSTNIGEGQIELEIEGPPGTTILARGIEEIQAPVRRWADGYQVVEVNRFTLAAAQRPFVGVSPQTTPVLMDFLRQQGYIVESSTETERYDIYLDRSEFRAEDQRSLLIEIEEAPSPLVRLGRWPDGARNAMVVSGDIDALTVWDYGLRMWGR